MGIEAEMVARAGFPASLLAEIVGRCNLRCEHCYLGHAPSVSAELSTSEWIEVFEQAARAGVLWLTLTGGEVALRGDLVELVAAGVDLHFALRLKSNGVLLTPRLIDDLARAGLVALDLSLYHVEAARHDAFVGHPGAWAATVGAARAARDAGMSVRMSTSIMDWNADAVPALRGFYEREEFEYGFDPVVLPEIGGGRGPLRHRASVQQLAEATRAVGHDAVMVENERGAADRTGPLCAAGHRTMGVRSNGDVVLCMHLPWVLGNVRDRGLREIWDQSERRKWFASLQWSDTEDCSGCEMGAYCGRCPAAALYETGNLFGPSPGHCRYGEAARDVRRAGRRPGK